MKRTPKQDRAEASAPGKTQGKRVAGSASIRQGKQMLDNDSTVSSAQSDAAAFESTLLETLAHASGKTLSAPEVAQAMSSESDWHNLLVPIRRTAVKLALDGRLVIYRKGKPADPNDFRGVYRLGLPRHD